MPLVAVEKSTTTKLFWLVAAVCGAVLFLTAGQENAVLLAAGILLMLAGLWPFYLWLLGLSHGLPLWPAFSAYSTLTAALPVLQASKTLTVYTEDQVLSGVVTMLLFNLIGTVVWISMTARTPKAPKNVIMIQSHHAVRTLFLLLSLGLLFGVNELTQFFVYPGQSMQVARGISVGLSYMGIFVLAYYHGKGLLPYRLIFLYILLLSTYILLNLTSLMLASAASPLILAFFGYSLGSAKLPWKLLLGIFVLAGLLHPGKYAMRNAYWGEGSQGVGLMNLPAFYSEWLSLGLQEVGGVSGTFSASGKSEDSPSSVFSRAGNIHMLLLVQDKTPRAVPFLNGQTYERIPYLLVPRFLAPDKGLTHIGNIILSGTYGLVDMDNPQSVSIAWSLVAEAYANFGYIGVFILSIALASSYSLVTRLTAGVPMTSLRFVIGLVVLAGTINENSLGVFITMQFQGVVGVMVASVFLMRSEQNPFAAGERSLLPQLQAADAAGAGGNAPRMRWLDGGRSEIPSVSTPPPMTRVPRWAPQSHHAAAARARALQLKKLMETPQPAVEESAPPGGAKRPRMLAVPFQSYYRARSSRSS